MKDSRQRIDNRTNSKETEHPRSRRHGLSPMPDVALVYGCKRVDRIDVKELEVTLDRNICYITLHGGPIYVPG